MDYSAEFLNEPSGEDMARFFTIERELDGFELTADQKVRKAKILSDITQFIGSRERFTQFLLSLEALLDEARSSPASQGEEGQQTLTPRRDERFDAYWTQFNQVGDEELRAMINGEVRTLSREGLLFLHAVILGFRKVSGEAGGGKDSPGSPFPESLRSG